MKPVAATAAYVFVPFDFFVPANNIPEPEKLGLLYHPLMLYSNAIKLAISNESIDLRAYLTAAFLYSEDEFLEKYPDYPSVVKKYRVIRDLLMNAGFTLQ